MKPPFYPQHTIVVLTDDHDDLTQGAEDLNRVKRFFGSALLALPFAYDPHRRALPLSRENCFKTMEYCSASPNRIN